MEKSIRLTTEEVRAVLDGRKTMIRRIVKPHLPNRIIKNISWGTFPGAKRYDWIVSYEGGITNYLGHVKPPYQPGDVLWTQETWARRIFSEGRYCYKADENFLDALVNRENDRWHPSIHMPREAARLFLQVMSVRVERLQDTTEEDARAEGFYPGYHTTETSSLAGTAKQAFMWTWQSLGSWVDNSWVWVIEFERTEPCARS